MTKAAADAEATWLRPARTCGNEFEKVEWAGTLAVHLADDRHLGLRFNDPSVLAYVADALGDRVREHRDPVPYYSVRLGVPGRRKATPLHHLYVGTRPVLGTRDIGRLLGGVARHLSANIPTDQPGHVVDAIPVHTPRGLLLVPADILAMAGAVDRLLTPAGFRFADVPQVRLDLSVGTVTVPEPVVQIPVTPADARFLGPTSPETVLAPGDYPLAGWLLPVGDDESGPLRPAAAVMHAAGRLEKPFPYGARAVLDGLVELVQRVPMTGVSWATHDELVGQVLERGRAPA